MLISRPICAVAPHHLQQVLPGCGKQGGGGSADSAAARVYNAGGGSTATSAAVRSRQPTVLQAFSRAQQPQSPPQVPPAARRPHAMRRAVML